MQPPETRAQSEMLAAETNAAGILEAEYAVQLNFGGVQTMEANEALMRASRGGMLMGLQLKAVGQTIAAGQRMKRQIQGACRDEDNGIISELRLILEAVSKIQLHESLSKSIGYCIDENGGVRDSASPELENARQRVASLEGRCKGILNGYPGEAIEHNGRWCVAMSDPSTIPPKALVVGTSTGGSVSYVEPQAAVPINNELLQAHGFESAAEEQVLWKLTGEIEESFEDLQVTLQTVCWLDGITAKSRFGNWIGGTLAKFSDFPKAGRNRSSAPAEGVAEDDEQDAQWLLSLKQLKHPLLLAKYLKKQGRQGGRGSAQTRALSNARQRLLRNSSLVAQHQKPQQQERADEPVAPIASDICIHKKTRALIITGPNTGGKTITLKAVGIASLMARCGVPIPAAYPARLPCFSSVLADIGDEQSLSASLSTFSGHLNRIQSLRYESDSQSLVLLDEVGTGTDPSEGTALGIALLRALVKGGPGGAAFTMATTHHSALTSLKFTDGDGVFENASVEFNEEELRPTYRLLMGVPGRSNALNIASRLGLDGSIVEAASQRMGNSRLDVDTAIMELERLHQQADADDKQCIAINNRMSRVATEYRSIKKQLDESEAKLALKKAEAIKSIVKSSRAKLNSYRPPVAPTAGETSKRGKSPPATTAPVAEEDPEPEQRVIKEGDMVFIPKLQMQAMVVTVKSTGKLLDLKVGAMTLTAKAVEVELVG